MFAQKIKKYFKLLDITFCQSDRIDNLCSARDDIAGAIFHNRIQSARGTFQRKPTNFIVPYDWRYTDPCSVTMYRNADTDYISDDIVNLGTDDDVKTFSCPRFDENAPCNKDCQYRAKNNQYFELSKKIDTAKKYRDATVAARRDALRAIFKSAQR